MTAAVEESLSATTYLVLAVIYFFTSSDLIRCLECTFARRYAAEGPDEESSDGDVSEGQSAGSPWETGQRTPGQGGPGALHGGEER